MASNVESTAQSDFEHALEHLESSPELVDHATPEQKLKLYGLYKQATCGDCREDAPSMFNMRAKLKHDAWKAQSGLRPEDAYRVYTKTVQELDPFMRLPSQNNNGGGGNHKRSSRNNSSNGKGSTSSLSALVKSDSNTFLDRLLGAPPRLSSPAPSLFSDHSFSARRAGSVADEDVEEKSSTGQGESPIRASGGGRNLAPTPTSSSSLSKPKKAISLNIGGSPASLEELRRMVAAEDTGGGGSTESSILTSSAPATPQQPGATTTGVQSVLRMRKSSSLTWGKAEDYTPLRVRSSRHRRKSDGDDIELAGPLDNEDDDEEGEESSNMEWDSGDESNNRRRTDLYFDESDGDDAQEEDEYDENEYDEEEEDEYGESRLKRRREDSTNDDGGETLLGTLLFTMPFVFCLKVYQFFSSMFFFPLTTTLSLLGFRVAKAPDTTSVREKKQAASMLLLASIVPMTPVVYMWMFFFLIFPFTTLPTAAYIAWMLYWDESPRNGLRRPILRDVPLAKYFVEYFPITLIRKSAQLDNTKKYVFAYHPHGIIGLGSFGAFATHAAGFKEKFPGIDMRLLTLDANFKVPILREVLLSFGVCSCSRKSCNSILNRGPGSAICLVVGGAAESLETQEGTYRLVLGRKGFVQVAIENNAELVPVIAFGETDAFDTFSAKPGTILREIQVFIQRKLKFTVPIFWGRGMFNTNFGLMPKRRPIHVVTGEPLSIQPFRDRGLEGEELLDAVHKAYIAALRRLFDENKDECEAGIKRKESLTIIK